MADDMIYYESGAYGRRLENAPADRPLGKVWPAGMIPAGEAALRRARQLYGDPRDESDFDFQDEGATIIERETGKRFRRATHDCIGVTDPKGVAGYCERDGWLIFWCDPERQPEIQSVQTATVLQIQVPS